ncbi:DNA-binding transcriptional response regulator, NtrC family, contains REC, AAA-type ATPase, and a Fis-type DNA-binding domains [Psychroflexus salarius]|uniref:DNA-binding transcriptional response regulator, NtrC family, contains REC, AAA-type ATPase, and a Fis-type DNA-binding domains n=1 Tax=Psychroflexus salarius TaxID=1155689 RepID=A0A1M4X0K0_9FLAO|nr:sigma-54 dependent transcriptional regulator [Psychroflexus salarius]SHE86980.1 DNA-binding transcriptional response regulator, NtrC family, contains REC, AAA-type ATPase, and a Fis-type DNA-binding domains [Psychroflexus salarius]
MSKLLIAEDEASIRRVLTKILTEEDQSFEIIEAEDGEQACKILESESIDLLLCDIKMPKKDGVEVLQFIKSNSIDLPVIMISGHGDIDTAVETMRQGAFDYISKPPDLNRLLNAVRIALKHDQLHKENKTLKKKVSKTYEMIGEASAIAEIKSMIDKVAPTAARVLITGENGTGKELVAHWLHEKSERNKKPFIEVNCAAIPSELIESELFGHVKGAFTSANKDRAGKFEAANGGTLFLDEIGDMSLQAQAKVLRALQEQKIQRIGSDKDVKVDVRVIAATNKNLKEEIKASKFREDLYHRLAVILIKVPSLKERIVDVDLLANHFLSLIAREQGIKPKSITKDALEELKQHDWPGNIREFRNVIERLTILGKSTIDAEDIKTYL